MTSCRVGRAFLLPARLPVVFHSHAKTRRRSRLDGIGHATHLQIVGGAPGRTLIQRASGLALHAEYEHDIDRLVGPDDGATTVLAIVEKAIAGDDDRLAVVGPVTAQKCPACTDRPAFPGRRGCPDCGSSTPVQWPASTDHGRSGFCCQPS